MRGESTLLYSYRQRAEKRGDKVETTTGQVVYTQDELSASIEGARKSATDYAKKVCGESILEVLREEVRSGDLTTEYATELHNKIAVEVGFSEVSSIQQTYTVSVSYNNEEVALFTGIEADDEDDAVDKVSSDLEVDEVEISITLSFNGTTAGSTISGDSYDILQNLELTAEVEG